MGFITNHGYLDNPTFRGMRWHLLDTFDKIYVLDLHGNAKKKEVTPEGKPDKNVFDIQQGVAIIVGVKKKSIERGQSIARVFHADLWGDRAEKYSDLWRRVLRSDSWSESECKSPKFIFSARFSVLEEKYRVGFSVNDFMPTNGVGMVTARDNFSIGTRDYLISQFSRFVASRRDEADLHAKFPVSPKLGWSILAAHDKLQGVEDLAQFIKPIAYRPFDFREIFYHDDVVWRTVRKVMPHLAAEGGFGLCFNRAVEEKRAYTDAFVFDRMIQHHSLSLKEVNYIAPLYLYPTEQDLDQSRRINFDPKLYARLQTLAEHPTHGTPNEVAVFDYVYGVLHCPAYRATYSEFLKTDFPRIPWPTTPDEFWDVSGKGTQLRKLHLMDPATIGPTPYPFKGDGNAVVDKPRFEDGKVWINATQCFDNAPEVSWTFYIGGYQPAQKWLKDRKGRALNLDDVKHYRNILKILSETDRIMQTITMTLDA